MNNFMDPPELRPKVALKRLYCCRPFCSSRRTTTCYEFSCKRCPVSHSHMQKCIVHKKCLTKPSNMSTCSIKNTGESTDDEFDFFSLPLLLQDRFFELASLYQKSKLQYVNRHFLKKIQPETPFEVYEKMVINKIPFMINDVDGWGKYRNGVYINPLDGTHIDFARDLFINYELVGIEVQDGLIAKAITQNVKFYLESIRMERCNLSRNEIEAICEFGALKFLYLDKIVATSSISMKDMTKWLKNATRIWIDVKNMKFESDWPMEFLHESSSAAKFDCITLKHLSFNLDVKVFDRFVKERVIQSKNDLEWAKENDFTKNLLEKISIDCVINISFNEEEIKGCHKKAVIKKLNNLFAGFYKNVTKVEFQGYKLNEKFIVERMEFVKSNQYPYPPRAERIVRYFYVCCDTDPAAIADKEVKNEWEVDEANKEMGHLQI